MKKLFLLVVIFAFSTSLFAQLTISGDSRIRPRYDMQSYGDYPATLKDKEQNVIGKYDQYNDFYVMYRARLNFHWDINEGWFFHTRLATNGVAFWTGKFGTGDLPSTKSIEGAGRGTISFMQLYYGVKKENWGIYGGLIPLNSLANPMLDLHFYPSIILDVPYLIFSSMAGHGVAGYVNVGPGKLNITAFVDNNNGNYKNLTEDYTLADSSANELDTRDQFTLMFDYNIKFGEFTFQPVLFYTIADDDMAAPMTLGLNFKSAKIAGFTPSLNVGYSNQSVEAAGKYSAWFVRAKIVRKIGPGELTAWFDLAQRKDELATGDQTHDFTYTWWHYKIKVFESERGEVSLMPTWRMFKEVADTKDYTRHKIELTTEIKFK